MTFLSLNFANEILTFNAWAALCGAGLLRACLQGGIAFLLVGAVCYGLRSLPSALHSWLWRFAYLKLFLALCGVGSVALPLLHPMEVSPAPLTAFSPPASSPVTATQNGVPPLSTSATEPSIVSTVVPSASASPSSPVPGIAVWLLLLWGVGAIWSLVRLAGEWCAAEWLRRLATPVREEQILELYTELCRAFALSRPPRLCVTEGAGSPVLLGGLRETIVLPVLLIDECTTQDLRLILAHELAHRKRCDLLWGWLPALAHCLFWFFPLEWWAAREYRLAQEIGCDALAVAVSQTTFGDYGETLLKVASQRCPNLQSRLVTVGVIESPQTLKRRLLAMKHGDPVVFRKSMPRAVCLILVGLLGLPSWRIIARANTFPANTFPANTFPANTFPANTFPANTFPANTFPANTFPANTFPANTFPANTFPVDVKPGLTPGKRNAGALQYQWRTGESYVYAVKIDSQEADYDETIQGNATYTVSAVEDGKATLTCRGGLMPIRRTREGRIVPGSGLLHLNAFGFGGLGRHGSLFAGPNEIKIDAQGHILSTRGGTSLPRALGDLSSLIIETLSAGKTWETDGTCNIVLEIAHPLSPHSHFAHVETQNLPASEHTSYTLGPTNGNLTEIDKHYELRTSEKVGESPRLEMTGDGQIQFDTAAGTPKSMTFKVVLVDRPDRNTTVETPVTLTYHLLEGQEREQALHPPPPPKVEPKALNAEDHTQILADLASPDNFKKMGAANRLTQAAPDAHRTEIARALEPLLSDKDGFVRTSAVKALAVWGDKTSVSKLIERLDDDSFGVRWAALEALGTLKDPRAAEPVAKCLKKDHDFAAKALKAIGPAAAPAVVPYLKDDDWAVRLDACHILKEIGTKASVPALETASHDSNGLVSGAATEALKAISAR